MSLKRIETPVPMVNSVDSVGDELLVSLGSHRSLKVAGVKPRLLTSRSVR